MKSFFVGLREIRLALAWWVSEVLRVFDEEPIAQGDRENAEFDALRYGIWPGRDES